jgi:hypothetical protein
MYTLRTYHIVARSLKNSSNGLTTDSQFLLCSSLGLLLGYEENTHYTEPPNLDLDVRNLGYVKSVFIFLIVCGPNTW